MQIQHSWVGDDGGYSDGYGVFVYNLASVAETMGVHATGCGVAKAHATTGFASGKPRMCGAKVLNDHPVIVQVEYQLASQALQLCIH